MTKKRKIRNAKKYEFQAFYIRFKNIKKLEFMSISKINMKSEFSGLPVIIFGSSEWDIIITLKKDNNFSLSIHDRKKCNWIINQKMYKTLNGIEKRIINEI